MDDSASTTFEQPERRMLCLPVCSQPAHRGSWGAHTAISGNLQKSPRSGCVEQGQNGLVVKLAYKPNNRACTVQTDNTSRMTAGVTPGLLDTQQWAALRLQRAVPGPLLFMSLGERLCSQPLEQDSCQLLYEK